MMRISSALGKCARDSGHALVFAIWILGLTLGQAFAVCPNPAPNPPPVTISPQLPSDVCVPVGFPTNPIQFFDDFSWRSFIALVWPVENGARGTPDAFKSIGPVSGPLVFETFKADWEVFQPSPDGINPPPAPAPWESFAGQNPCSFRAPKVIRFMPQDIGGQPLFSGGPQVGFGDMVLAAFSKFEDLGEAGFGGLVATLPAQYTRYATFFNQLEFNKIVSQKLYLRSNIPPLPRGTLPPVRLRTPR
jgi:hypothetical protein